MLPSDAMAEKYTILANLSSGGMGTVHLGRAHGAAGFRRIVAIKCLHPHLASDASFVAMFLQEARLASRVRHPNVCSTLDVTGEGGELRLVMDYVHGESLSTLIDLCRSGQSPIPAEVVVAILVGTLAGLHAAHEARSESGDPLEIVHRDVSPQNVMVGEDGVPRVLDFGIAKAAQRVLTTQEGQLKGKIPYMSPEQLSGEPIDRRTDVYAAGVVLWEALTLRQLVSRDPGRAVAIILNESHASPRTFREDLSLPLEQVVMKALSRNPGERFATAHDMLNALEAAVAPATPRRVSAWVQEVAGASLERRAQRFARLERNEVLEAEAIHSAASESPTAAPSPPQESPAAKPVSTSDISQLTNAPRTKSAHAIRGRWTAAGTVALILAAGLTLVGWLARTPDSRLGAPTSNSVGAMVYESTAGSDSVALVPMAVESTEKPTASPEAGPATKPPRGVDPQAATAKPVPGRCSPPFVVRDGVKRFKPECL